MAFDDSPHQCWSDVSQTKRGRLWGQGTRWEVHELYSQVVPSPDSLQNHGWAGSGKSCALVVAESLCLHPVQDSGIDIGDISARKALRKQLQCKTFRWYLVSVYPEMRMYSDIIAYGVVRSSPLGVSPRHRQRAGPERGVESQGGEEPLGPQYGTCGRPVDKRLISGAECEAAYAFIAQTSPFP